MPLARKNNRFDCEIKAWNSILIFHVAQGFRPAFRSNAGDSTQSAFADRPKPESSGLELEAKLEI